MTNVPCNPLFDGWRLTISWQRYIFLYCLAVALGFRIIHALLRARAVQKGDFPHTDDRKEAVEADFWKAFRYCFFGDNKFKEHSDLWIPFAIGLIELATFPILLVLGQTLVIGGWLGIKTVGSWMGWQASRTSFNRFLLFSLLNLSVSYLWLCHYVQRLPCP